MVRKIFLLGYTDAAWRMQKLFKMMSGVDHKWIPHWPPLLILQRRHSTTYGCVSRSIALFVFIVHLRPYYRYLPGKKFRPSTTLVKSQDTPWRQE